MIEAKPRCKARRCKHHPIRGEMGIENKVVFWVCDAFPGGIPEEIAFGDDPHGKEHPDQDNDIVYEREEG